MIAQASVGANIWPGTISGDMNIDQGTADLATQRIATASATVIVPIIVAFVANDGWVLRGKITTAQAIYCPSVLIRTLLRVIARQDLPLPDSPGRPSKAKKRGS